MVISDQGWATIQSMEHANSVSHRANEDATIYAMKLMVQHLAEIHGFGIQRISRDMNLKKSLVKKMLCK